MPFEVYTGPARRRPRLPAARISTRGRIMFNKSAMAQYMDGVKAVILAYDKDANRIGIKPVEPGNTNAYTFNVRKTTLGGSIPAKRFFDHYKIEIPSGGWNNLAIQREGEFYTLQLS